MPEGGGNGLTVENEDGEEGRRGIGRGYLHSVAIRLVTRRRGPRHLLIGIRHQDQDRRWYSSRACA